MTSFTYSIQTHIYKVKKKNINLSLKMLIWFDLTNYLLEASNHISL